MPLGSLVGKRTDLEQLACQAFGHSDSVALVRLLAVSPSLLQLLAAYLQHHGLVHLGLSGRAKTVVSWQEFVALAALQAPCFKVPVAVNRGELDLVVAATGDVKHFVGGDECVHGRTAWTCISVPGITRQLASMFATDNSVSWASMFTTDNSVANVVVSDVQLDFTLNVKKYDVRTVIVSMNVLARRVCAQGPPALFDLRVHVCTSQYYLPPVTLHFHCNESEPCRRNVINAPCLEGSAIVHELHRGWLMLLGIRPLALDRQRASLHRGIQSAEQCDPYRHHTCLADDEYQQQNGSVDLTPPTPVSMAFTALPKALQHLNPQDPNAVGVFGSVQYESRSSNEDPSSHWPMTEPPTGLPKLTSAGYLNNHEFYGLGCQVSPVTMPSSSSSSCTASGQTGGDDAAVSSSSQ